MKTALIAFGDELVHGLRVNTNAQEIVLLLRKRHIVLDAILELPDREDPVLEGLLQQVLSRMTLVITTGGLGPTGDDRTRTLVARLYGRPLHMDQSYAEKIEKRFGKEYPKEAVSAIPEGSLLLPNSVGTACGFFLNKIHPFPHLSFLALPGPPDEMKALLEAHMHLLPHPSEKRYERTLFLYGRGEHEIYPRLPKMDDVEVGIYPSYGFVELHLSSPNQGSLAFFEQQVQEKFPRSSSLGGRSLSFEAFVVQALIDKKWTVACAESCTGGLLSSLFTSVPGSSQTFLGGVVVYSDKSKQVELSLTPQFLEQHGSVSEETAGALALACQKKFHSSVGIGIVGYLGPTGGTKNIPCGTVYISLAVHRTLFHKRVFIQGGRKESQRKAALWALSLLAERL